MDWIAAFVQGELADKKAAAILKLVLLKVNFKFFYKSGNFYPFTYLSVDSHSVCYLLLFQQPGCFDGRQMWQTHFYVKRDTPLQ